MTTNPKESCLIIKKASLPLTYQEIILWAASVGHINGAVFLDNNNNNNTPTEASTNPKNFD